MKKVQVLLLFIFLFSISSFAQATFINEVNYLASNPAQGIEIAGQAGQDLTGWSIEQYSTDGQLEDVQYLDGMIIPDKQNGRGTIWTEAAMSYAGGPALVNDQGNVVQVLNYGLWGTLGSILPIQDGSAAGMIGEFIGVQLLPGSSLQLTGTGIEYDDFSWLLPGTVTPGEVNTWQLFSWLGGLLFSEEGVQQTAPIGKDNIALYPNPATNFVRISLLSIHPEQEVQLHVFDQQGRLISSVNAYGGQQRELNVTSWPSGTYILKAVSSNQEYSTTFIKQ